jgi:hypothetical protein
MTLIQVGSGTTSINVVKNTNNNITEFKLNSITITDDTITFNAKIIFNETTPTPAQKYYFKINTTQSPPPISYSVDSNNSVDFTIGSATTPSYTNDILSKQLTLNILDDDTKTPNKYNTYIINIPLYESFKKIINFDEVNLTYFSDTKYSISESDIPTLYNMKNGDEPYLYSYDGHIRVNNKDFYKGGKTDSVWSIASPQPFYYDNPIFDSDKWVFNNKTITFTMNSNPVNDIISHEATINNLPIENYTSAQGLHTIILKSTKTNYSYLINKIKNIIDGSIISSTPFYDTNTNSNYYNYNLSPDYLTLRDIEISGLEFNSNIVINITNINAIMGENRSDISTNISLTGNSVKISELNFNLTNIIANEVECNFIITYSITINSIDFKDIISKPIQINNGDKIKNLLPDNFDTDGYGFPSSTITLDNSTIDNFKPLIQNDSIFTATPPNLFSSINFEYNKKTATVTNNPPNSNYTLNFNTPIINTVHITQNIKFNKNLKDGLTTPSSIPIQFKSQDIDFLDQFVDNIKIILNSAKITSPSIVEDGNKYYNYNLSKDYITLRKINITYNKSLPSNSNVTITNINASIGTGTGTGTINVDGTPKSFPNITNTVIINELNFNKTNIGTYDNKLTFNITYSINGTTKIITTIINNKEKIGILSTKLPSDFFTNFPTSEISLSTSTLSKLVPQIETDTIFKTPSNIINKNNIIFLYGGTRYPYSPIPSASPYTINFNSDIPIIYDKGLTQTINFSSIGGHQIINGTSDSITFISKITNLLEQYIKESINTPNLVNNENTSIQSKIFKGDIYFDIPNLTPLTTSLLHKYLYNIYLKTDSGEKSNIYTGIKGVPPPQSVPVTEYNYGTDTSMYIYVGYVMSDGTILYTTKSNSIEIRPTQIIEAPTVVSVMNNSPDYKNITGEIKFTIPTPPSGTYNLYYTSSATKQPSHTQYTSSSTPLIKLASITPPIIINSTSTPSSLSYNDGDIYFYLISGVSGVSGDTIYGYYSNPIMIPKISIKNPQQINYSNFWPYSFDMNTDGKPVNLNYVSCGPIEIDYSNEATTGNNIYNGEGFIIYRGGTPNKTTLFYNRLQTMNDGDSIWIKKNDPDHNLIDEKKLIYSLSSVSTEDTTTQNSDPFSQNFDYSIFKPVQFPLRYDYDNGSPLYYIGDDNTYNNFDIDYLSFPLAGVCTDGVKLVCTNINSPLKFTGLRVYHPSLIKLSPTIFSDNKDFYNWYINIRKSDSQPPSAPNYLAISSKFNGSTTYEQDNTISVCSGNTTKSNQSYIGSGLGNNELYIQFANDRKNYTILDLNKNKLDLNSGASMTIQLTNSIAAFNNNYLSVIPGTGDPTDNCLLNKPPFTEWDYIDFLSKTTTIKPQWTFINRTPSSETTSTETSLYTNTRMNVSSWGYSRTSTGPDSITITLGTDRIISSGSTQFNLSFRDHATTTNVDLTPNFIIDDAIKADYKKSTFTNYLNHSFGSNLEVNYINSSTNTSDNSPVISTSISITATSTTNINMSYNKLYMVGIPTIRSVLYKKLGTTSDPTKDTKIGDLSFTNLFQSLVQLFIGREKSPIFTINSAKLDTTLNYIPETNDILINNKLDIIHSPSKYYIRQEPLISNSSTLPQKSQFESDTNLNKSITYIKGLEETAIESISGSGGNMKCIYIGKNKSDLTVIDNVIAIAGGGGGGGVYSQKDTIDDLDPIMNSLSAFNGRDGLGLNYKEGLNDNIKYKADLNNMNGGSIGCYASTTSYQINTSCLGGSVHTFKNEKKNAKTNNWYYNNYGGRNNGFYPQIHDTTTDIISVKINGYSYIDAPIYAIKYNKTSYFVDSGGLKKTAANEFGNGGSADNSNLLTFDVNQWGAENGSVNFNDSNKYFWNKKSTPTYSRGGGGGGGFGGGSAGGYFYFETFNERNKSYQTLSNIPPGGGGGGNSFYNKDKYGGNAYGFEKGTTTLLNKDENEAMPSLLSQLLNLSRPDLVKNYKSISSYSNGDNQESYIYLYNS